MGSGSDGLAGWVARWCAPIQIWILHAPAQQQCSHAQRTQPSAFTFTHTPPHAYLNPCLTPPLNSLHIKAEGGESAVLCTGDKTFALQQVETSNALLLVPLMDYQSPAVAGAGAGVGAGAAPDGSTGLGAGAASEDSGGGAKPVVALPRHLLRVEGMLASNLEVRPMA